MGQFPAECGKVELTSSGSGHDIIVGAGKEPLVESEKFPDQTLDAVANHGIADLAAGCYAEARSPRVYWPAYDQKMGRPGLGAGSRQSRVFR